MKNLLLLLLAFPFLAAGQTEKNITPLPAVASAKAGPAISPSTTGTTRAVVIGISDYQDPAIPDLRFADKDAEAFAHFLQLPGGGLLDGDHLKLLINSEATVAQFDAALGWLIDESKPGDQAIIYFSGHGDVETKTHNQHGFLLCWDSPPQSYISGAYPIFFLKDVITTLSTDNKARVLIITDACRSGKLAGNNIGGAQLTSQNLAQQFANEIKILSCQPNEYSLEGEQWGGGRGVFSFHLVDGLYGLADANNDGSINLMEINRYLEDHVVPEVSPQSQVPMTIGNRTEKLTTVFPEVLAQVKKYKAGQAPVFSPTDSKGIEEEVLATVDSNTRALYYSFKKALKEKVFLEPPGACADAYYLRLVAEPKLERLHHSMRRNYAAALQDDAQQAINNLMKMEPTEIQLYRMERLQKYAPYPRLLGRAAELLGPDHYMNKTLRARKVFFEAWLLQMESPLNPDSDLAKNLLHKYREAVILQSEFALAYYQMSTVFKKLSPNSDSLLYYTNKAFELAPSWTWAINRSAYLLCQDKKTLYMAKKLLDQSMSINPDNADTWNGLGYYHYCSFRINNNIGHLDTMEQDLLQALKLDSTNYDTWYTLGILYFNGRNKQTASLPFFLRASRMEKPSAQVYLYLGAINNNVENLVEAEKYYKQGLAIEPYHDLCGIYLAGIYMKTERKAEARALLQKILAYDSTSLRVQRNVGNIFLKNSFYTEAEAAFKKCISLDSLSADSWIGLGLVYRFSGRSAEAESTFKKWISLSPNQINPYMQLGILYLETKRFIEADSVFNRVLQIDSTYFNAYYSIACAKIGQNQLDSAFDALEKTFMMGCNYPACHDAVQIEASLAPLRERKEQWKALMKKYFPDQVKD